jgi:hypothetical protein
MSDVASREALLEELLLQAIPYVENEAERNEHAEKRDGEDFGAEKNRDLVERIKAFLGPDALARITNPLTEYDQLVAMLKRAAIEHERSYPMSNDPERQKACDIAACKAMDGKGDMEGFYGHVDILIRASEGGNTYLAFHFDEVTGALISTAVRQNIENNIF